MKTCPICGGAGELTLPVFVPCPACGGKSVEIKYDEKGRSIWENCPTCGGSGGTTIYQTQTCNTCGGAGQF